MKMLNHEFVHRGGNRWQGYLESCISLSEHLGLQGNTNSRIGKIRFFVDVNKVFLFLVSKVHVHIASRIFKTIQ